MTAFRLFLLLAFLVSSGMARAEAVLRVGAGAEPETIDPAKSTGLLEGKIEAELFEGLVSRDAAGQRIPGAAQSWDISDDGLVYRFHLRPDLKYSNGEPVLAGDFVYALRRLVDPATGSENGIEAAAIVNAAEIEAGKVTDLTQLGAAAPDDRTVVITLRRPSIRLIDYAIDYLPLRKADIDRYGAAWTKPGNLVGNGAFTLAEWVPQSHLTLRRNPFYREAATVKLDEVRYIETGGPETAFKMFRAGELDVAELPKLQIDWAKRNLASALKAEPEVGCFMVGFNTGSPPFDDIRLRRALALVVDQDEITEKVVRGDQVPAHRFISPLLPGYPAVAEAFDGKPMAERIAEARTLYAEAGYGPDKPLRFDLMLAKGREWDTWSLAVANTWHDVLGVEVKLDTQEWQVYLGRLNHRDFTAAIDDWITLTQAPSLLDEYRSTSASNELHYASPAYDQYLIDADTAHDVVTEYAAYAAAEKLLIDAQAILPVYHPVQHVLVAERVKGWLPNPADSHRSRFIHLAGPSAAKP
jgi:oligopeptide transport system substrate-binding protein